MAILLFLLSNFVIAQNESALFEKRISAFTWMPDGNAIILNIVKVNKTENGPPIPKKFKYYIPTKTVELLAIDGGGLAVSPDSNSVAYIKHINGKDQIYLYNFTHKEDKPIVIDTLKKFAVNWSPDGKNLIYNIQIGKGAHAIVDICTYNFKLNKVKHLTQNISYKCYTPQWNTKNNKVVYTMEKGDKRDQIFLTDINGSFHTNLTNDTATHNYSPSWLNKKTIMYIQSPDNLMTMKIDGSQIQSLDGIKTTQFKYNSPTNSIIFLDASGNLILFNIKSKTETVLIKQNQVHALFNESYYE